MEGESCVIELKRQDIGQLLSFKQKKRVDPKFGHFATLDHAGIAVRLLFRAMLILYLDAFGGLHLHEIIY